MPVPISKYTYMLGVQTLFILADLIFNIVADTVRMENVLRLILFIIQDVALVFSLIVVFLNFVSTYVFQAGLVGVLLTRFRATLALNTAYLALSVGLHSWSLDRQWADPYLVVWTPGLLALYAVHRIVSVLHYYFYKRTALELCDPELYEDSPWLQKYLHGS
ncbi:transmembrane protein 138-like [Amphibalanus amphitrite]|uniref:transmembrane protein 138-like n=1 Tax=Amphibalanus amphitrite TaxID=1232801 RepID=UPI001C9133CA|nr:transmembrane protein 138-like [Amphibalanus amphitrite]